jgi:hypothetical protein
MSPRASLTPSTSVFDRDHPFTACKDPCGDELKTLACRGSETAWCLSGAQVSSIWLARGSVKRPIAPTNA